MSHVRFLIWAYLLTHLTCPWLTCLTCPALSPGAPVWIWSVLPVGWVWYCLCLREKRKKQRTEDQRKWPSDVGAGQPEQSPAAGDHPWYHIKSFSLTDCTHTALDRTLSLFVCFRIQWHENWTEGFFAEICFWGEGQWLRQAVIPYVSESDILWLMSVTLLSDRLWPLKTSVSFLSSNRLEREKEWMQDVSTAPDDLWPPATDLGFLSFLFLCNFWIG